MCMYSPAVARTSDTTPHRSRSRSLGLRTLSPGPVKTVSAVSIGDFGKMLDHHQKIAPLRRNITTEDVGGPAVFYVSDLSRGVTGSILPVDSGYSIMGASAADEI